MAATGMSAALQPGQQSQVVSHDFTTGASGRASSEHNGSSSDGNTVDAEKKNFGANLEQVDTSYTTFDGVAGTANMFREDGTLVLLPAPTRDPRDPLNLPAWHKFAGLTCLCFLGALAASAEIILGAMLPVFSLEYTPNIDPKILLFLSENHLIPADKDPLVYLQLLPGAPPIWHVYLLGSLPLLIIGVSNLALVPLAIAVGRRWVVVASGILAIAGAMWAGFSQSLGSHIGARCLQAVGAGTVESLIPFIVQDMVHYHQRNSYISLAFAAQGTIIIGLGIAAPHIIIDLNWRWVYYVTAAGALFFLGGVLVFMPETRWHRSKAEMNGIPKVDTREPHEYQPRTWQYNIAMMHGEFQWNKGWVAFLDTLRTFFYPHIFFITLLNSAMVGAAFAAAFTTTPKLLQTPYNWPFLNLGLCLIAVLIAALAVGLVTGKVADEVANFFARRRGRRLPENQLINLVLPSICGILGALLFGLAGQEPDKYPWPVFLTSLGFLAFGFLGTSTVGAVYVLESYPQLAGPALVNIASFRFIVAFALSFKVSEWIIELGYRNAMLIYTGITAFFVALIPVVFIFGPAWRVRFPGPDRH